MQFRLAAALSIFVGSYLPLAIILAVQDIPHVWWGRPVCTFTRFDVTQCSFIPFQHPGYALTFLVLAVLSTIIGKIVLSAIAFPHEVTVTSARAIPNEIINYTFPYVVAFMGISYAEPEKLLGFLVFLIWMFAITYKSGQILMNPLLLIFGWKLYEVSAVVEGERRDIRVLLHGRLTAGQYNAQRIQDFFILAEEE